MKCKRLIGSIIEPSASEAAMLFVSVGVEIDGAV
jgi:hypothetical protein